MEVTCAILCCNTGLKLKILHEMKKEDCSKDLGSLSPRCYKQSGTLSSVSRTKSDNQIKQWIILKQQ